MKKCLFAFALLLAANFVFAQNNSEKNLVKTFSPEESTSIILSFRNTGIKNSHWAQDAIRIELNIKTNMPEQVMEQLIRAGRYTLVGTKEADGKYVITAPELEKKAFIKGIVLQETIFVTSKTPSSFIAKDNLLAKDVEVILGGSANRGVNEEQNAIFRKKASQINEKVKVQIKIESSSQARFELKTGDIIIDGKILELQ